MMTYAYGVGLPGTAHSHDARHALYVLMCPHQLLDTRSNQVPRQRRQQSPCMYMTA